MKNTVNVSFDIGAIANKFALSKNDTQELMHTVLNDVSNAVIFEWRAQAVKHLRSTREIYLQGIQKPQINKNVSTIELIGVLPNMIEGGASAFDMKIGFQKSKNAKTKKNGGWFITIPFRHGTPGTTGDFFKTMPKEVYGIMRQKKDGEPLSTSELPKNLQKSGQRSEIRTDKKVYGVYHHKTDIFTGMQKQEKNYSKATQSKYMTFRRVSDKSDSDSWIHRGFRRADFAGQAVSNVDADIVINNSVDAYLRKAGL